MNPFVHPKPPCSFHTVHILCIVCTLSRVPSMHSMCTLCERMSKQPVRRRIGKVRFLSELRCRYDEYADGDEVKRGTAPERLPSEPGDPKGLANNGLGLNAASAPQGSAAVAMRFSASDGATKAITAQSPTPANRPAKA
jgi:hypothetical protein